VAITYVDATGNQRIYVFASGNNGHLEVNYWDGFNWNWADQGVAPGGIAIANPAGITYQDNAGNQLIYVFAVGSNGHLEVNYWDGFNWNWADQGLPPGTSASELSVITYLDASAKQLIYAFVGGNNGHLSVNYWDGFRWHWADHGLAPGGVSAFDPGAITYKDAALNHRIYVFVAADNGHLGVNYCSQACLDGFNWKWADQGTPLDATVFDVAPVTYVDAAGNQRIYVFVEASNGHLGVNYWDGFNWNWAGQGLAPAGTTIADPAAISYVDVAGNQRIYAFAISGGELVVNYWDGFNWNWADQGTP
jgi:hypothetical protein